MRVNALPRAMPLSGLNVVVDATAAAAMICSREENAKRTARDMGLGGCHG